MTDVRISTFHYSNFSLKIFVTGKRAAGQHKSVVFKPSRTILFITQSARKLSALTDISELRSRLRNY